MSTLQLPTPSHKTFAPQRGSEIDAVYAVEQRPSAGAAGRSWPSAREWLLFTLQGFLVVMIELGNDIVRGNLWRPDLAEALSNARQVVRFEVAHNLFVEPALQVFFQHTHIVLGIPLTWSMMATVANNIYAFCHIFVTLGVAVWIFVRHRSHFSRLRNIMVLTNLLALVGYEVYPMAPPRLTTGLWYHHHAFHFQDTMRHILGTGTLNGTPIGYNPFSAMPSLHVAWAIVIGGAIVLLARHPLLRALGALYPGVMVFTVVVTANHYLMDAVGAAIDVSCATMAVLLLSSLFRRLGGGRDHTGTVLVAEPVPIEKSA